MNKFEKLYELIKSEKFLKMQALAGEVPFFIWSYNIKNQSKIYYQINKLKNRLRYENNIKVAHINLYELVIEILERKGLLNTLIEKEKELSKEIFIQTLINVLDIKDVVIPAIEEKISKNDYDLIFITGIGEVYPYIRSHTILNNLQSHIVDKPLILFFPGKYTGKSLELFGIIKDDNYYRAYNLDELIEV